MPLWAAPSISTEPIPASFPEAGCCSKVHPETEWDKRIGWLQSFYGGGQVVGLILAGILSTVSIRAGLFLTAVLTAVAIFPAWFLTPKFSRSRTERPVLRQPVRHAELHAGSPQRHYAFSFPGGVLRKLGSPFGLFIIAWLITFMGAAAFFSLYPVLMKHEYGVDPATASGGFAVAAALGLALYPVAGRWSKKIGAVRLLQLGFGVRVLAFLGFATIGVWSGIYHPTNAMFFFLFVVLAWSFLSVAGTEVTFELSRSNEGEGIGVYNAATAVAGVLGAVVGGWLADRYGYDAIPMFAFITITAGLGIVSLVQKFHQARTSPRETQTTNTTSS